MSDQEGSPPQSGGALLVECLVSNGVSLWTCVPGESYLPVLDAIYETQRRQDGRPVRLITTRHEAAAANMAEAAGKLTGRAGVCLVTRGPGATHSSVAVHTAYQDGTPMILIAGQVARADLGRQAFQEMDLPAVFASFTKHAATVMSADRIPEHVARAVHIAHAGRPGPVLLVVPEDVLREVCDARPVLAPEPAQPELCRSDYELLNRRLRGADRPVIVAGGPGWTDDIGRSVIALAENHRLPVVTAFRWQDAVNNASPAYAGYLGLGCNPKLRRLIEDSDLVVGLGPRLDDPTTDGYRMLDPADRLLLVSQDAEELCRTTTPAVGIHCGLRSAVEALETMGLPDNPIRTEWLEALRGEQDRFTVAPSKGSEVDVAQIVAHIRTTVADDAIVTTGAGNYTTWVQRFFEFRRFGTQLAPRNGAMGYGLPAALAAAAVAPGRTVVAFAGDGCLLMSGSELATAVQFGLQIVLVVLNNSMFGTIRMHQERSYPGRVIATDLRNPDFAAYARSFGALGTVVEKTGDFPAAFADALAHRGPAVIEVRTDPEQITPDLKLGDLSPS